MCLPESYFTVSEGLTTPTAANFEPSQHCISSSLFVYISYSTAIFGVIFLFKSLQVVCLKKKKSKNDAPCVQPTSVVDVKV